VLEGGGGWEIEGLLEFSDDSIGVEGRD